MIFDVFSLNTDTNGAERDNVQADVHVCKYTVPSDTSLTLVSAGLTWLFLTIVHELRGMGAHARARFSAKWGILRI